MKNFKSQLIAGEIAQWLRACGTLAEDPSSIPSNPVSVSQASVTPASGGISHLWLPWHLHSCAQTYTETLKLHLRTDYVKYRNTGC